MKARIVLVIALLLFLIPTSAHADDDDWWDWDWHDIGEDIFDAFDWEEAGEDIADSFDWNPIGKSIAESFYDFVLGLINAPIQPLINTLKELLQTKIDANLFKDIWNIIRYVISLFYGLLFMWSGFNFIVSGDDPAKREKAKAMLKNIIIMIILINASFYIYSIVLEFNSLLTEGVLGLISSSFFNVFSGNPNSIGLELVMGLLYIITLSISLVVLAIRYILVAFGVAFFPIGLFLYFIEPVKSYGKLIINFLATSIFLTFFVAVILLVSSKVAAVPYFENMKILLMIAAFGLCNLMMLYLMFFAAIKAAFKAVVAFKAGPVGAVIRASRSKSSEKQDDSQKTLGDYT